MVFISCLLFNENSKSQRAVLCSSRANIRLKMSDSESDCEIERAAEAALATLVPEKSRKIYEETYRKIDSWCAEKNVENFEEKILLAYFSKLSSAYKPSTLWSTYSMLRTMTYLNKNVDISVNLQS